MFLFYIAGEPNTYAAYFSLNKTTAEMRVLQPISRDLYQKFTLVIKVKYKSIFDLFIPQWLNCFNLPYTYTVLEKYNTKPVHYIHVTVQCNVSNYDKLHLQKFAVN